MAIIGALVFLPSLVSLVFLPAIIGIVGIAIGGSAVWAGFLWTIFSYYGGRAAGPDS